MSLFKKLAGETAIYGLSSVVGRLLNYLLVPLYTAVFAPDQYGVVTELYAYIAFLNILYVYGLETAYFRFSSTGDSRFYEVAFTSILLTSCVFSGTFFVVADDIATALSYPDYGHFIRWGAVILAVDAIVAIPFAKLRQNGQAKRFAFLKLLNIGLNIGLNLFFILLCPYLLTKSPDHFIHNFYDPEIGVGYVFLSNLIANGSYLLFFLPEWRSISIRIDAERWVKMMKYAWPILIIGFAGVTNEMLSRAILKHRLPSGFYELYSSQEILGIFGACFKLSVFMTLAIQAFRYAFEPFFFQQAADKNSPQTFSRVMTLFVWFGSVSWCVLSLFLPYYAPILLRQESYLVALDSVPFLLGGGLFLGIFYNLSIWYKLTDKTIYGAFVSILGAASTLALNWYLIPILGYMGSAYATFFSYLVMLVVSYFFGRKYYPVPYEVLKICSVICLSIVVIVIDLELANLSFKIGATLLLLILLYFIEIRHFIGKRDS